MKSIEPPPLNYPLNYTICKILLCNYRLEILSSGSTPIIVSRAHLGAPSISFPSLSCLRIIYTKCDLASS